MNIKKLKFNKNPGLSLLEIIICTAILSFLLAVCALILHWALNVSSDIKARGNTANEAIKSISWLVSDLCHTSVESIYIDKNSSNSIKSISFLSGVDESLDMEYTMEIPLTIWKNYVIYYLCPNTEDPDNYLLVRKTFYDPLSYPDAFKRFRAEPMKPPDINSLCDLNLTLNNGRIVARNIYDLQFVEMNRSKNSCTLTVITRDKAKADREIRSTYTTTVILRNTVKQPI